MKQVILDTSVLDLATRSFEFTLLTDYIKEKENTQFTRCNSLFFNDPSGDQFAQWGVFEDFVLATLTFKYGYGSYDLISDEQMWSFCSVYSFYKEKIISMNISQYLMDAKTTLKEGLDRLSQQFPDLAEDAPNPT
jgi:hypothetical protein